MTKDEEHLRLLSIFHYVVAGVSALFAMFPILHLVLGIIFLVAPENMQSDGGQPPPAWFGWFFILIASTFIVMGWIFAALVATAGRFLAKRKHHTFCLVMGGVECIFIPFGTVLGVFTIVVLIRESVKNLFEASKLRNHPGEK